MDLDSPVVSLCVQGTQAEFKGKMEEARGLYWQAWEAARDDYEACIAAHYVAHMQENAEEVLRWNQEALDRAERTADERVKSFYPSLYLNMGQSFERLGNQDEAQKYYDLAAELGAHHRAE
jgi:tetratricopeptide (TPR) repeat protein